MIYIYIYNPAVHKWIYRRFDRGTCSSSRPNHKQTLFGVDADLFISILLRVVWVSI